MVRKNPFPPEAETKPDSQGNRPRKRAESAPAPKSRRERAEAPTLPPPRPGRSPSRPPAAPNATDRVSDVRAVKRRHAAATVDEVTADLSKDPRHERDDDDGGSSDTER